MSLSSFDNAHCGNCHHTHAPEHCPESVVSGLADLSVSDTVYVWLKGPNRYPQRFHHIDRHYSVRQWAAIMYDMQRDPFSKFERATIEDKDGNIIRDTREA